MKELARHLDKEIKKVNETDLKKMWTDRFIYKDKRFRRAACKSFTGRK